MPREYTHMELHASGRVHPDKTVVRCEAPGCSHEVLIGQSYSFLVVFATTGPYPIGAFQCEDEQHFACSPACARAAAIQCIDEHLIPAHRAQEVVEGTVATPYPLIAAPVAATAQLESETGL